MDFEATDNIKTVMADLVIPRGATSIGKRIVDLGIPATVTILSIKRQSVYITPNGSTRLQDDDAIAVLAEDQFALDQLKEALNIH